jgi:predicted RNA-binding Zn-ribbon protein involved in translation (DUF1610 family)
MIEWRFEKFIGDSAIYIVCPKCGFLHNVSYIAQPFEVRIDPQKIYNYCPNCGEEDTSNHYEENREVIWNKRSWKEINKWQNQL